MIVLDFTPPAIEDCVYLAGADASLVGVDLKPTISSPQQLRMRAHRKECFVPISLGGNLIESKTIFLSEGPVEFENYVVDNERL
ncbi:MAG TPA: hypothetical protein DDX29_01360 [Clostridiales bacterium]|nr:hypothetical protein [Clostridiales bacterium]